MKKGILYKSLVVVTAMGILTGFGLDDVHKKLSGAEDCSKSSDPKKCKKEQKLKGAAEVIAIGVAAKLVIDMIVEYRSTQTSAEDEIIQEYKKRHASLPAEPQVVEYTSSVKPGEIVKAGNEIMIDSNLSVVPGIKSKEVVIQEQIEIYDNEKNDQVLKSLTKPVNEKTKKCGAFKNEFKFTLPAGMPQGVYPIKTLVLIDGVASKPSSNKMQLVLNVDKDINYQIVALTR